MKSSPTARELWTAMAHAARLERYPSGGWTAELAQRRNAAKTAAPAVRFPRGMGDLRSVMERALRPSFATTPSFERRLNARLVAVYSAEILARGGETEIATDRDRATGLAVAERRGGYTLLRCDAWRYYSRRSPARRASLVYLCGRDDAGRWAVRVPSTVTTIAQAIEWIEPKEVKAARRKGRQVIRQGDVYLVESRSDDFSNLIGTSHRWDNNARLLAHEGGHASIAVPFRAKAIVQSVLRMGRQGQFRRHGD